MNGMEQNPVYLISAYYNKTKKINLRFYDPVTKRLMFHTDNTGHLPYCLTDKSPLTLNQSEAFRELGNKIKGIKMIEKINPMNDEPIVVTKISVENPLVIGGKTEKQREFDQQLRNLIPMEYDGKVWEAYIKYHQNYLFDNDLMMGLPYILLPDGPLRFIDMETSKRVEMMLSTFSDITDEEFNIMKQWAELLEYPAPRLLKCALDIEVLGLPNRIPDPDKAEYPIIACGFITSDGKKIMLLLERDGIEVGDTDLDCETIYFDSEQDLIKHIFKIIIQYPFIFTFNGDQFDLLYIYNRAKKTFNMTDFEIPLKTAGSKHGFKMVAGRSVHIDLYRFFNNRSLQNYAFQKKYSNFRLDDIAQGLIGKGKITASDLGMKEEDFYFENMTYTQLAKYCFGDVLLTYELTDYDDELVIKLMTVLMRISNMPMEDVTRTAISQWIKHFLYFEHRKRNYLIPTKEELKERGEIVTKAVIKGKKYKGAEVVDPPSGIFFDVSVVDFSSLYPSLIKEYNIGYQSMNCNHEECLMNKVPQTTHHICTKRRSLTSLLIGTLRDLRIKWYKPQSKNKDLSKEVKNWYTCVQEALKVILNASYGVFGSSSFALYCGPVGEAVTAFGRHSILETIKEAQARKIPILYGDTDSLFVHKPKQEDIDSLIEWSKDKLKMDLELDQNFRFVIFSARKKNYLCVRHDGTIDVKGLTGKKKHMPDIIKSEFEAGKKTIAEIRVKKISKSLRKHS